MSTAGELKIANYLMAVEGLAMIRRFASDPGGLDARADEITAIVQAIDVAPLSTMVSIVRYDVEDGYARWAPRYDGPNPAIAAEAPLFRALVQDLPPGRALDAACGTGRHAEALVAMGWDVIGVDTTEAMLDHARAKVPAATFHTGRLEALPLESGSIDLVVCALALTHVEDLAPVYAEFSRVLRPGGRAITSDIHPVMSSTGGMAAFPVEDERPDVAAGEPLSIHYVPNLVHHVHEYVSAIVAAGLEIVSCSEPLADEAVVSVMPSYAAFPEATREAFVGWPYLLIWDAVKPTEPNSAR